MNGTHGSPREGGSERPIVILLCGLPGSGKTTFGRQQERVTGAIRFSTDEWMADLGLDFFDALRNNVQDRLDRLWAQLVERGLSVILEDGTWQREERDEIRRIAEQLGASTELHYFDVPFDELWRRLETRNARPAYGAVPITREILEDSRLRLDRPDQAEFVLFDRHVVHR